MPSRSDADAGLGGASSFDRGLSFFLFGRWPGCGEETRLGGVTDGLSFDGGGVGRGFVPWLAFVALGSISMSLHSRPPQRTYQEQLHWAVRCEV